MQPFKHIIIGIGLLSLTAWTVSAAEQNDALHPFPKAEAGFKRTIIRLPKLDNEDNCKVEIIIGKTMKVDCNHHWFGGSLEAKNVEGWGYTYWVLSKASGPASTLMGCPDGSLHDEFVKVEGDGYLLRYNSRLSSMYQRVLKCVTGSGKRRRRPATQRRNKAAGRDSSGRSGGWLLAETI